MGTGPGLNFNLNIPLPKDTGNDSYLAALQKGVDRIKDYQPDVLVVSLGVDTFELDPVAGFKLTTDCYPLIGKMIAQVGVPVLFIMEGGYAIEQIADNVCSVLTGFENK